MSRVETDIDLSPKQVWATLGDAQAFQLWVAGCKEVRHVEGDWPQPGSAIHHRVGVGLLTLDDTTTVEEMEEDHRLVLRARFRPVGVARVVLTLTPSLAGGTHVAMEEKLIDGPVSLAPDAVSDPLLHARNTETLRRLKNLSLEQAGRS